MSGVFAAGAAVLSQRQFFGCLGFVSLSDIVEIATNGAFQA